MLRHRHGRYGLMIHDVPLTRNFATTVLRYRRAKVLDAFSHRCPGAGAREASEACCPSTIKIATLAVK